MLIWESSSDSIHTGTDLAKAGEGAAAGRFSGAFTGKATRQADGGRAWNDER